MRPPRYPVCDDEDIDTGTPACWAWPVTAEHMERGFRASRINGSGGGNAKLLLIAQWQDGRCGICGSSSNRLVDDHDHSTGYYRGKLCGSCNTQEGHASDRNLRFARYRFLHPAAIMGVRLYWAQPEPEPASIEDVQRWMAEHDPCRDMSDEEIDRYLGIGPELEAGHDPARRR